MRFKKSKKGKDIVEIISVEGGEIKGIAKGREYSKRFDSMPAALRDALYPEMAKKHKDDLAKANGKRLVNEAGNILKEYARQNAIDKQARKEREAKRKENAKSKGKGKKKQNGRKRKAA